MAELINLNRARKARARADAKAKAAENRVLHGRTKTEREGAAASTAAAERRLDGHKRDPSD